MSDTTTHPGNPNLGRETVVISVGGSLIVPDAIDSAFLSGCKALVESQIAGTARRFILIAGGGKTARRYQEAAAVVSQLAPDDLDWLGIEATRLNALLLRTIFARLAYRQIVTNPDDILDVPKESPLVIAAGYRPGASTDLRAVQIARNCGATKLINLSNIDYLYSDDPRTNPHARKIERISWPDFTKLIPVEWTPGLSSPFDPIAARAAEAFGLEVAIMNGANLHEVENYLEGKPFTGTILHP